MKDFFTNNREKLIGKMNNNEVAVLFSGKAPKSTADSFYRFKPNKNFYYFTGICKENFILTLLKLKDRTEIKLFIEAPNYDVEKWTGRKLVKEKAKEISGIENIEYLEAFDSYLNKIIYDGKVASIYFDLEKNQPGEIDTCPHRFAKKFRDNYLHVNIKSLHQFASEFRVIKEEYEIDQIKSAIMLTKLGLDDVMKTLKPKLYEYQIEATFNHTIMQNGAETNAFETIAASGENAVILHYVENECRLKKDTLILMDLGAQYKQYASDITRTYPVSGKFTDRQKQLYEIVLKANKETQEQMIPGISFLKLNEIAKNIITEELKRIGLIENDDEVSKYYYHSIGHHMGLDTHDLGDRDCILEPGMVITCEPGLYVAEEDIGIRIEDDILITETGNINLSKDIIKEVEDIEKFMAQK